MMESIKMTKSMAKEFSFGMMDHTISVNYNMEDSMEQDIMSGPQSKLTSASGKMGR